MADQNPLQFFTDLANKKPIQGLAEKLFDEQQAADFDVEKLLAAGSFDDLTPEPMGDNYWYSNYFVTNLPGKMSREKSNAVRDVDILLAGMADLGSAFSKLTELVNTIDATISKLHTYEDVKLYPEIIDTCNELKRDLQSRKKRIVQPTQADKDPTQSPVKIQWLGQVNVLGTLFYHLLKGQDGGPPYISASVEQVKRMLVDNFVDSEGYDLSKSTLDTILMPNRSEKRANIGDRIELPNKKAKK